MLLSQLSIITPFEFKSLRPEWHFIPVASSRLDECSATKKLVKVQRFHHRLHKKRKNLHFIITLISYVQRNVEKNAIPYRYFLRLGQVLFGMWLPLEKKRKQAIISNILHEEMLNRGHSRGTYNIAISPFCSAIATRIKMA